MQKVARVCMWETHIEFQMHGSNLAQPHPLQHPGNEPASSLQMKWSMGTGVGRAVETRGGVPASHGMTQALARPRFQLLANVWAQVVGSLPPVQKFWDAGFSVAFPHLLQVFGG